MAAHTDTRWYWLNATGIAWVRANMPDVRIKRHAALAFYFGRAGWNERRHSDAVVFARGGLAKARKAGLRPREAEVETSCGTCHRRYIPHYQHDPCIANLPGVRFACCGHGEGEGYVLFENGVRLQLSGSASIGRCPPLSGECFGPNDDRFWEIADRA